MSDIAVPASALSSSSPVRRALRGRRIFLAAACVSTVLAVAGFWRTYVGALLSGAVDEPVIIHVHVVVMVMWLVLFMAQVWFAASGRVRLHVQLGPWVMGYAVVMVLVGLLATSEGFAARLATGDVFRAQRWLFGVLRDLVFLVPFLAAGWACRRSPEVHKRLMLVATTILLLPAVSRMAFLGAPVPLWTFMLVWPLPVYLAMGHDFSAKRMVHPVYVMGVSAMLAMRLVLPLNTSPAWHAIAAHITALYAPPPDRSPGHP